nr:immunoglobulin light chain junction region [Macaca mulatta]MOW73803.1 immunoglobulin light chain junction region [Macaca mulatta]MOW73868.1 immunoglobulin light chain junction region [Macaca mulatta]MOW74172.1 immunoglobulin light chain junction region [Macaca mulatta]MOW74234.1 immunoglobulin light chain junction region [Macaca mulatta]
CQQNYDIPFTF